MNWRVVISEQTGERPSSDFETKAAALESARILQSEGFDVIRLESAGGDVVLMQDLQPDPLDSAPVGRRRKRRAPLQTAPAGRWSR